VKRLRNLMLLCCLTGLLVPGTGAAMDADELIAKHLEATGGVAKLKAVESQKVTGKVMVQGMEIPLTIYQKRPNRLRSEAQVMGKTVVQCYDGAKGWSVNPMTGSEDPQPMSEFEEKNVKLQADMDGVLVDYADKGYTAEYLGEDEVEGTPAHKLRLDTGQDIVVDFYFDKDYFLVIKQDSKITFEGNEIESSMYMSDYQEVDGLIVPFAIETRQGDMTVTQIMLEAYEFDVPVDDAIFVMPAPQEAPPAEAEHPQKPDHPQKK